MPLPATEYDYIVTGAGSAGCVLAARLSEDPDVSVLVLEAGGRDTSVLFHWPAGFAKMTKGIASWGWSTVPQRHMKDRRLWYTQAKVIGGGSTINAQIYTRGNAKDYDAWAEDEGCDGWSYREVLPYFKRAEGNERFADVYHGDEGPLGVSAPRGALPICDAFIRAAQQYGIPYNPDFNGRVQSGVGYYQLTQRAVRRSSAATAYLKAAERRQNLTVLTRTQATRIAIENGRAVGVEVVQNGAQSTYQARREVIVTSGAIGSPRLLMLSGIGPADHLRSVGIDPVHDVPGVGQNLQDHIDICVLAECTGPHSYDGVQRLDRSILAGLQYLLFKSGPVTSSLFETGGFWYGQETAHAPDIQFHFGQGSGIEKGIAAIDGAGVTLNSAFLRPRSRGTVTLASADPEAAPLIDPNYWAEPYDLDMSLRGLAMARDILRQPALQPFIRKEALPGADVTDREALFDYACRLAKTDHHPVGTCRMGHGDMAVVGPDLKLRGLDGLRICDSSIMPTINSSNTNAPTIMIAEKASDLIRGVDPLPATVLEDERNDGPRHDIV
ncbi:MAG: FAD-dependent oxidoreductase [Rhodobacter sp.]|nr:FAD-dependent oxidoreductase [Rhodobacter sp.]